MIWTLVRRELLDNLLTMRLTAALSLAVVLSVLTALIGSMDYSRSMDVYRDQVASVEQRLSEARIYSDLWPTIVVPPQPLAIFCRGTSEVSGLRYYISHMYMGPPSMMRNAYSNNLMATLMQIDFTTVVMLLLSFLAIALGFDGICGERERGTLGLLLASPIPRLHIVLGKLAGGILSLWIPLALSLIVSLLIVHSNPDVQFSGDDWLRLGLFFVLSCAFLAQVFALSLMVSSFAQEAATSLILCLILWLAGGVGYSSVLPSLVRYGTHEPPWEEYASQRSDLWASFDEKVDDWENRHPGPGPAYMKGIWDGPLLRYAHPEGYEYLQRQFAFYVEEQLKLTDRQYELLWINQRPLAKESHDVDEWSILSPFTNYRALAKVLSRTTIDDMFVLARYGRRHRDAYISYLREKGAFSSRRWFTDDPVDREPLIPNPEEVTEEMLAPDSPLMVSRLAWADDQQKKALNDPARRLDLSDMPKFGGPWRRSLAESLAVMGPGLLLLALLTTGSVLITIRRLVRYDPR